MALDGRNTQQPSHMTLPFEYQSPVLAGIQVFGFLMVTVFYFYFR